MDRYRFTLEYECEPSKAGFLRELAVETVADHTDGLVRGHVVREIVEDDEWDELPLLER